MSVHEIIAELPHLTPSELEAVDANLHELLRNTRRAPAKSWGEALLDVAGTAQGLPEDFAQNHDYYLSCENVPSRTP